MVLLSAELVIVTILCLVPFMPQILMLYQAPPETMSLIYSLLIIALAAMPFVWPVSFIMPCVMRATGDARFSSYFALITKWVIRVGLGYIFSISMGLGVQGVWYSMILEWAVRSVVFWIRYKSDVWMYHPQQ